MSTPWLGVKGVSSKGLAVDKQEAGTHETDVSPIRCETRDCIRRLLHELRNTSWNHFLVNIVCLQMISSYFYVHHTASQLFWIRDCKQKWFTSHVYPVLVVTFYWKPQESTSWWCKRRSQGTKVIGIPHAWKLKPNSMSIHREVVELFQFGPLTQSSLEQWF